MPHLHVRHVQFDVKINDDSGSGARRDLATWKPHLEDGWYYLEPAANNGDARGCAGVIVKPAGGETKALVAIGEWEMVWNDAGSGKSTDYALWRGLPALEHRTDYAVLGGFFVRSHNKPTVEEARGMMAIHKENLVTVSPGREIWSDAGSGARMDGAVWEVSTDGHMQAIGTGAFVPVEGRNNRPRDTYALDATKIIPETLIPAINVNLKVPKFSIYQAICDALEDGDNVTDIIECYYKLTNVLDDDTTTTAERHTWELAFKRRCGEKLQARADSATRLQQYDEAIEQYSSALSLDPPNATVLLINRSKARAMKGSWDGALEDANEVIALDPFSPWGYERKHASLHGAGKYSDAINAHESMLSVIAQSPDPQAQKLCEQYTHPSNVKAAIRSVIQSTVRELPRVLIDTTSGRLCGTSTIGASFDASAAYNELISSMTTHIDLSRIRKTVTEHYRYVMLSHNWDRGEPSFQMVEDVSIYDLKASPTHNKLRNFCLRVRDTGFRWAWSDTCCIDKKDLVVLQESLVSMFKWYRGSTLTIVYLRGVERMCQPGGLVDSAWNSRTWTYQEYIAAEVIQFYTEDWTPYLNIPIFDHHQRIVNHKASPFIIQEMRQAIRRQVGDKHWPELQPGLDHIREKLCPASTRQTTYVEDAAYSLFGILSTSIPVIYGEGENALGRFLAQVLMTSRDVSVLAWTGESSRYNSCLAARITVFKELATPYLPSHLDNVSMERVVSDLRTSLPDTAEAMRLYDRLHDLQRPWFAGQCMHLPCITFPLGPPRTRVIDGTYVYRAGTTAFGVVEIRTTKAISRPNALYLIHPWINVLLDRRIADTPAIEELDLHLGEGLTTDDDIETLPSSPLSPVPAGAPLIDKQNRALCLVARLRQPFGALLLEQSSNGVEYRRVAADTRIVVRVLENTPLSYVLENIRILEVL